MIRHLQELMLKSQFSKLEELLTNKGSDYANQLDVFKNFRDTAQILGIRPEKEDHRRRISRSQGQHDPLRPGRGVRPRHRVL